MTKPVRRAYKSQRREQQAQETKSRILDAAGALIKKQGFAEATIEAIAAKAGVAVPTVFAAFGSKRGILQGLVERTAFNPEYEHLVREAQSSNDPETRLRFAARISRAIQDTLRHESELFRGADAMAPDSVTKRENVRYERQFGLITFLQEKGALRKEVSLTAARDILWSLTGRPLYKMLVIDRGWASQLYEDWLADTLILVLLQPKRAAHR